MFRVVEGAPLSVAAAAPVGSGAPRDQLVVKIDETTKSMSFHQLLHLPPAAPQPLPAPTPAASSKPIMLDDDFDPVDDDFAVV